MLGETVFTQQLGEIALSKTTYDPAMVMDAHAHEFAYASLVVEGHYAERSASVPRHLKRGMLVFHPAGEIHADCVLDQTMATVNVEYLAGDVPAEFICAYGSLVDDLSRRLLSSLAAAGPALEHSIESLREFLWSTASRTPPLPRIARAREALAEMQREAPVASLAAKLGMHRGQLHRAFKRAYGESPRCDLTKRRAASAVDLLVETSLSIAEVAAECGYYDQSHFCRQFRMLSGMSPSRFRAAFTR